VRGTLHFASSWFGPDYHFGVLGPSGSFARLGSAQLNSIERQSAAACRPISAAFFKPAPGHVPLIWLSLARRVFAFMKCCEKVPKNFQRFSVAPLPKILRFFGVCDDSAAARAIKLFVSAHAHCWHLSQSLVSTMTYWMAARAKRACGFTCQCCRHQ